MTSTNLGVLSTRANLTGAINSTNPVDLINFTIAQGSSLNAGLVGLGANADLRLFRAGSSAPIIESQNSGNSAEAINLRNLTGGDYILQVNRVEAATTNYSLNLSTSSALKDVVAVTASLGTLSTNASLGSSGLISDTNTADQYRFHLNSASFFNAVATNVTGDVRLRVFRESDGSNSSGFINVIRGTSLSDGLTTRSLNMGGFDSQLAAGDYVLQVEQVGNIATPYSLEVSAAAPSNLVAIEKNLGVLGSTVITTNGLLGSEDTSDFYQITVNNAGPINISLAGATTSVDTDISNLNSDIDLRLIKDNGDGIIEASEVIADSHLSGITPDSINLASLGPGTYLIQTHLFNGFNGYTLRVSNSNPSNLVAEQENLGTLGSSVVTRQGEIGRNDTSDIYRFDLTSTRALNADLLMIGTTNLDLRLFKDDGNGIIDAGDVIITSTNLENRPESINLRSLAAGTYFVQVLGKQIGVPESYTLNLSTTGVSDLIASEEHLGILGSSIITRTGNLNDTDTSDIYTFFTNGSNPINLSLTGLNTDLDLRLLKDTGNGIVDLGDVVAQSGFSQTTPDSINLNGLAAGTYYIQVVQFQAGSGNYTLRLSNAVTSNLIAEETNLGVLGSAPIIETGVVNNLDTSDIYRFDVTTAKTVHFELSGITQDIDIALIHDVKGDGIIDPEDIVRRGRNSGTIGELFLEPLLPGTYFLQVHQFASNASPYTLTIADEATLPPPPA